MNNASHYSTQRDRQILDFVDRYRLGTTDLFARAFFPELDSHRRVGRTVGKLVRQGLLRKVKYAPNRFYFVLTRRACRKIGAPDRTPPPLTEQSLPVALAIASYCVRNGVTRWTARELRKRFPELWRPGLPSSNYYLVETPQGMKLGMFLVNQGGTARRIKSKIRRILSQRISLPAFQSLMAAERFRVCVLTGSSAQCRNIQRQLERFSFHDVEIEVSLVPELGTLLTLR